MRYLISEAKDKLKVGDWVRTNGDDVYTRDTPIEGEIGDIDNDGFYIFQNQADGAVGRIQPETRGYKYSWRVYWERHPRHENAWVEILDRNSYTMKKLTSSLKRILSPELQKLYKAGLIDGNLELTESGKNEIWALLQKQFEEELVKVAEEIIEEEEKSNN